MAPYNIGGGMEGRGGGGWGEEDECNEYIFILVAVHFGLHTLCMPPPPLCPSGNLGFQAYSDHF